MIVPEIEIALCDESDYSTLRDIWERSVRATHDFLTERDIEEIKQALIPTYFPNVALYKLILNGKTGGFIGLAEDKIEMLFIDSDCFGSGYGSSLVAFALKRGVTKVDVNEQNPAALSFYRSQGFRVVSRDATDEAGRPFPILHLSV